MLYRIEAAVRKGLNVGTTLRSTWKTTSPSTSIDTSIPLNDMLTDWQPVTRDKEGELLLHETMSNLSAQNIKYKRCRKYAVK